MARARALGVHVGRPRVAADATVDRAGELRGEGLSYRQIAERLAAEGVPTLGGKSWTKDAVVYLLKRSSS
ncbi:hypothetical protein Lfu02_70360 [Longispora fulva]|nr:hypothetical protein Lfu02_70360 [Longispora fulva]